jgi:hypothetical protein
MRITDWPPLYRYAQEIGASFVRTLPLAVDADRDALLFDWDNPEQRRAVQAHNQQPLEDGGWQAGNDPQFIVPFSSDRPCVLMGVQARLALERPDVAQLFFRLSGQAGYAEGESVRKVAAPGPDGEARVTFMLEDERGFAPEVRLDPIEGPGRFRLLGLRVTCQLHGSAGP